ncbi:MAG: NCS2 family permease [Clostridiaceae bacterium]|jgi:AGZA family xanthine/uracil permease-like MFS transporter|nr:NCS2 family permease [Bacillota bacterium]NLN51264.1 NCS2 family permease [Clostridiaceae bacterium]
MEGFFKLKENKTNVSTEIMAGLTTFFAMSYILIVNPNMLSMTGMPKGAVFLATILAAGIGTLIMGLFANVPYAVAPGMGLNAFFTFTVVFAYGYTWQQALAMVFICGVINVLITVTNIRKMIIRAIPESLQHAIGGGIGVFIGYLGLVNSGLIYNNPASEAGSTELLPTLTNFKDSAVLVALIGLVITIILLVLKVKGAILISIILTTIIGIPFGVTVLDAETSVSLGEAVGELKTTFMAAFGPEGLQSLFNQGADKTILAIITIFTFSLSDTFDTIGTFIGTGRASGIFTAEEEKRMYEKAGFSTRLDKALFADSIATSIGAVLGTSNTTTYVESTAGIGVGGRTGLTSVVVTILLFITTFFAPLASIVPAAATAPALIVVGIMMLSSFAEIKWSDMAEAIPAFFAAIFMGFSYSISYGIAFGFITYIIVKIVQKKFKELHPVLIVSALLFVANFIILAFN